MKIRFLLILTLCSPAFGQAWSGIIDGTRATDWSSAGTSTDSSAYSQCGTVIPAYTGSCTTLVNALNACTGGNHFVPLGTGTFTLSGCKFQPTTAVHDTVLRGTGSNPSATKLVFTSASSCTGISCDIGFIGPNSITPDSASNMNPPCGGGGASNCATWTAGYTQGTTVITVGTVGSNTPVINQTVIWLDQANDTDCTDGTGLIQGDQPTSGSTICSGNDGSDGRLISGGHHSQMEAHTITNIAGSNWTITPPIRANNFRSGQSPGIFWSSTTPALHLGIENVTIDHTSSNNTTGVQFLNCRGCWAKGVISLNSGRNHFYMIVSSNDVVRDSYICGVRSTGGGCGIGIGGGGEESYGFEPDMTSDDLIENNIFQQISSPLTTNQCSGCVMGYNVSFKNVFSGNPNFMQVSYTSHDAGSQFILLEGNYFNGIDADNQHGASPLATLFRNWLPGNMPAPDNKTQQTEPFGVDALNRAYNVIGNILGSFLCVGGVNNGKPAMVPADCPGGTISTTSSYHTVYEVSPIANGGATTGCATAIYAIGTGSVSQGCGNGAGPGENIGRKDNQTVTSWYRWGNYDTITKAVRWCTNSTPPCVGSEIPGAMNFVNAQSTPASHTLPASFYLSGQPTWWGSMPFPAIGPDVTGGQGPAGLAYETPAFVCYAGGTFTSGVLNFNPNTCYAAPAGPAVTLSTSTLAFSTTQPIGIRTWTKQVSMTNSGASALTVGSVALATGSQFALVHNCPSSLAAGAACQMVVSFNPTSTGAKTDSIIITTNAPSSPDSVALTGTGVADNTNVLYGTGFNPIRQLNIFGVPINSSAADYSHLTTVLALGSALFTGTTPIFPLGCSGSCTGANGTYLDHGTLNPVATFGGTNGIDTFLATITAASKINNLILSPASYLNNSDTSQYVGSQAWANTLSVDGVNNDTSLTWQPSTAYMPSAYILVSGSYWQMQATCVNADTHDLRCTSGSTIPSFSASPQTDGAATWTLIGANAPPQDYWCDSNTTGPTQVNCHQLVLVGAAAITGCPTTCQAQVTVTNPPTFTTSQRITVANAAGGVSGGTPIAAYNCSTSPCTVASQTATTVTYNMPSGGSNRSDTLSSTGNPCTAISSPQGCISGAHTLNINTTNATVAILQNQLPIPYEQPVTVWRNYLINQLNSHYGATGNTALGYIRPGCTKSGECNEDGIANWPLGSVDQYNTYVKAFSAFLGTQGCGSVMTCQLNLNTSPTVQAPYFNASNLGMDNNALGTSQVSQILAAAGCPAPGVLTRGGDWCTMFATYFTLPNGKKSLNTLQTSQQSTPGNCAVTSPAQTTGGLPADLTCLTSPFTLGYPGDLPVAAQFLANNAEIYFCDILLALDSGYTGSTCNPQYSQGTYQTQYQAAFATFLSWKQKIGSGSGSGQFKFK